MWIYLEETVCSEFAMLQALVRFVDKGCFLGYLTTLGLSRLYT